MAIDGQSSAAAESAGEFEGNASMTGNGHHPGSRGVRVPMRVKLLVAFAGAFTVVFGVIALWVYSYVGTSAAERLQQELRGTAAGGATTIDPRLFSDLVTTVPASPDADGPGGLGYPDSPLYRTVASELDVVRRITPDTYVYSYYRDPGDGQLYFAATAAYLFEPEAGVSFRLPVADVVAPEIYERMARGLEETTDQPGYTDEFGSWISSFSPIVDADGRAVGAIGVDYPLSYVDQVERDVRTQVFPVLLVSYLVLLALVLVLSTAIVRPLRRLRAATRRIADGDYDTDLSQVTTTRFPDEMYDLGQSFAVMAAKVSDRERSLTSEVRRLKVEIDANKRQRAVEEITGTDFFADLSAKASQMRARMREGDEPTSQE